MKLKPYLLALFLITTIALSAQTDLNEKAFLSPVSASPKSSSFNSDTNYRNVIFTETFEDSSPTREFWTQTHEIGSVDWVFYAGAGGGTISAPHNGNLNARFYGASYTEQISKLISPVIDFTGYSNPTLKFWYAQENWSGDQNQLKVYYRTGASASWIELAHYTTSVDSWTEVSLDLPNPGSTYQIAFEGMDYYGYANVIDDVTFSAEGGGGGDDPQNGIIGTGTDVTGTRTASPINVYYESLHGQAIYTVAELNAAGIYGPACITSLGFNVDNPPALDLPNFTIRLKHTDASTFTDMIVADGMQTVYNNSLYTPQSGWDMLLFSSPFIWNGTDNLLVDTAFSLIGSWDSSGTLQYSSVTDAYVYLRSDTEDQSNIFSGASTSSNRPNIKLSWSSVAQDPQILISPESLDFPVLGIGSSQDLNFSIANNGGGSLILSDAPQISGTDSAIFSLLDPNSYPLELGFGQSAQYTVRYQPVSGGQHSAQVDIDYAEGYCVSLSGSALDLVYGDGFESYDDFSLSLSPWTQYDGDLSSTYAITDYQFTNEAYTGSYIAFNPAATSPALTTNWTAYSGNKYAAAFASTSPPNNDWLISPAIALGSEASLSFWAKSVTDQYGLERFKVLYSTTGNSYTDFTNYLAGSASTYIEAPTEWTLYQYELPQSCANSNVYIAIQCVSNDAFVFMVDDFSVYSNIAVNPVASVSSNQLSFGEMFPHYSEFQELDLSNSGTGTLSISTGDISISGDSEFSLYNLPQYPIQLAPGQSLPLEVEFRPTTAGTFSATLSILDNTGTTTNVALEADVEDNLITQLPYIEGFEALVSGWVVRDIDGDGNNWWVQANDGSTLFAYTGNKCMMSRSFIADAKSAVAVKGNLPKFARRNSASHPLSKSVHAPGSLLQSSTQDPAQKEYADTALALSLPQAINGAKGALTPDNWLISPRLAIGENYHLSYRVAAQDSDWLAENYSVMVSNTTPDSDQFVSIHTETIAENMWLNRSLSLAEYAGDEIYIAFRHHDCTDQYILKLDTVKIAPNNVDTQYGIAENNEIDIDLDPIQDTFQNITLDLSIHGTGFVNGANVIAEAQYHNPAISIENSGLYLTLSGTSFSGTTLQFTHNLGFVPQQVFWRIVGQEWNAITPTSLEVNAWNSSVLSLSLPEGGKDVGDFEIIFPQSENDTLPVTLTAFVASQIQDNAVKLNWTTATETGVLGYLLLRAESAEVDLAREVSPLIEAVNSSTEQVYEFQDRSVQAGLHYYYWLMSRDFNGEECLFGPIQIHISGGDNGSGTIPQITRSLGNYPNPFNPSTTIRYSIAEAGDISIKIYNPRGQLLRRYTASHGKPGFYHWIFDAKDDKGRALGSGFYFYRFETKDHSSIHRMMLLK